MSTAVVVQQVVATATITAERGASSAVAYQQAPVATLTAEQGLAGPPGRPGTDGGTPIDLPDLALLFENGLV